MSHYRFSPAERAAIFSVHGEKCYICGSPLTLKTMAVDHVIPEDFLRQPDKLAATLEALGLPSDFEINSYSNWLPACGPCNGKKSNLVFNPSLLFQLNLHYASAKANKVAVFVAKTVSDRKIANALNVLEQAGSDGQLDLETLATLGELLAVHRAPEQIGEPIRLTPLYEVLSDANGLQVIRGPHGIGTRPSTLSADSNLACPVCGTNAAWSGARCVICGELIED